MSRGARRRLADLACRVLQAALPAGQQAWGEAVRHETAAIRDDGLALRFALGSLGGMLPRALAARMEAFFTADAEPVGPSQHGVTIGSGNDGGRLNIGALGMQCAAAAVLLGMIHLALAGAPMRYLVLNFGALLIGLAFIRLLGTVPPTARSRPDLAMLAAAAALLATAAVGQSVDGVARWARLGALSVQPSLILLPAMVVVFTWHRRAAGLAALTGAAMALAMQPDRAMAGVLAFGLAVAAALRPGKPVNLACGAGMLAWAVTLLRPDGLPGVPHVEGVLVSAFRVHPLAGMAVVCGSALLLVPAIMGWRRDPANRASYAVFGTVWATAIGAAALGNYPTPVVGYGGSAILGYVLSLAGLPRSTRIATRCAASDQDVADEEPGHRHLPLGFA